MEGTLPGRHAYAGEFTGTVSLPGLPHVITISFVVILRCTLTLDEKV